MTYEAQLLFNSFFFIYFILTVFLRKESFKKTAYLQRQLVFFWGTESVIPPRLIAQSKAT